MSVEVIGSEPFEEILAKIEEAVKGKQDQRVVEIHFPNGELDGLDVRETIHIYYDAEIIGDRLFIKYYGGNKCAIYRKIANLCEAHNTNWLAAQNTICVAAGSDYLPNVGIWFQWPTYAQMYRPIANLCPLPDVWFEIFYDSDPDRNHALVKIGEIQQTQVAIEFVGIVLPDTDYPFHQNPNPGAASILAPLMINQNAKPYSTPYVIHWDENNSPVYYKMDWNLHLALRCGVILDFNIILNVISKP